MFGFCAKNKFFFFFFLVSSDPCADTHFQG